MAITKLTDLFFSSQLGPSGTPLKKNPILNKQLPQLHAHHFSTHATKHFPQPVTA
jgi:hypothetical protein